MTGGPYRSLLFDLDGTLAETDSLHLPTWVEVLLPHGIEVDEAFYRENISGRANAEIVEAKEAGFRERAGNWSRSRPLGLLEKREGARVGDRPRHLRAAREDGAMGLSPGERGSGRFRPISTGLPWVPRATFGEAKER